MESNLLNRSVWQAMRLSTLLLLLTVCLTGCKSSKSTTSSKVSYLSSKVQLTIPKNDATVTVNGTMKLKSGERVQLSFLMPILRSELARLEVTPDDILLVDRMNKRYVRATRKELKDVLPEKADFEHLEKLLFEASEPEGKKTLTGAEIGISSLENGKIELSDFSTKELTITPTELSQKYTEVEWEELMEMFKKLQK